MTKTHLYTSIEFADELRKIGMLEPLVFALKAFKERQNYPFELQDKRIIKQALLKGYADLMGKVSFSGDVGKVTEEFILLKNILLREIEKDAERIYGKGLKKVGQEVFEEIHAKPNTPTVSSVRGKPNQEKR